jgi:hypothetical protein
MRRLLTGIDSGSPAAHPLEGAMNTVSPLGVTGWLQSRDRGEKAVLGEHIHPVHGEFRAQVPHAIGRKMLGFVAPTMATERAR